MLECHWSVELYNRLKAANVRQVAYVPDAGHAQLIELFAADREIVTTVLTTEEEGVAIAAGAWLGGDRTVLLMQSSGVGNLVNVLGMVQVCRFPLVMIITMRGEQGEFNPWQVPMGRATPQVLETMGVAVRRASDAKEVAPLVAAAYQDEQATAVLISQSVIGIKSFQEQTAQ